jgi:hypothetical protein
MSRPGEPRVKLLVKNAHLSFVVERTSATCIVCHELKGRSDEPACERCGLERSTSRATPTPSPGRRSSRRSGRLRQTMRPSP